MKCIINQYIIRGCLVCFLLQCLFLRSYSQDYFTLGFGFYHVDLGSCTQDYLGPQSFVLGTGATMTPESLLLCMGDYGKFYLIDQTTGFGSDYYTISDPPNTLFVGLVSIGNNIFYSVASLTQILYEINLNTNTATALGVLPYETADLVFFEGEIYFIWCDKTPFRTLGIRKLNLLDPTDNPLIVDLQSSNLHIEGISGSNLCHTLVAATRAGDQLVYINLLDGVITPVCETSNEPVFVTSMTEFETPLCEVYLDLDEDDSSGATEADYMEENFDCLSSGVAISDQDITLLYDALISEMTIEITGSIPDAPYELLEMTGSVPNIDVSGIGTTMITLSNAGNAKSSDFKDALRLISYNNIIEYPTAGPRTVDVQFATESGSSSNIATATIQVNELPFVSVDLGPDLEICDGETVTFDAGNPGAVYEWNTGSHDQTITTGNEGEYIVTVSNGVGCPNVDTVALDIISVIHVSLTGPTEICDHQQANMIIVTDSPFPLTVEINASPGSPFVFTDVMGTYTFIDLPGQNSMYTITSVIPSQEACIEITDPEHFIEVYPGYNQSVDVALCDGDSIWLGYQWEKEAGSYENTLFTYFGCDSVVTTTISILPAINISLQSSTCDSASAGVFITYLNNPNGCDTVVTTTVSLLPPDTTLINLLSCIEANVGTTTQILVNQNGCDSLVMTTTGYIPPSDTTTIFQTSCDSASLGVMYDTLAGADGCDSLIITTISMAPSDTTYLNGVSCDSASIGVSQTLFNNMMGCDSLVITTIVAGVPDTTYLFTTSCDSASLGVFETHYTTSQQCDSLVITTVTYSAQDSTFITGTSCDPSAVGVFIQMLSNTFGCDSIVTETISLLPSSASSINSTTCDPASAGVFTQNLINQYGCDSIVTETITLLPSDATFFTSTTCKSSEAGMFITTHLNQYGCDSIVTLTVTLIPSDTTVLAFKTCDRDGVGNIENLFIGQDGCDSLVVEETTLYPLPQLNLIITSDFNGYGISCFGEHDGSVEATIAGEDPFQYSWSTGDTTQSITGLGAGDYDVLITDANGCMTSGSIELNQPEEFSIGFEVSQPNCFTNEEGAITVLQSGGVLPVRYSKDGITYQSSPTFSNLSAGSYTITALDANDCEAKEIIMINVSVDINVDLGDDQIIMPGDTSMIEALINVPYDSLVNITWTGLMHPDCPTCLTQFVAPIITTAYTVSVSNAQGCSDLDSMTVFVEHDIDIYVPNVFSPNEDGINDRLLISTDADIEEIESFTIFDRWGNVIYLNEQFQPNDPSEAWDGKRKGVTLNPGVFAYKMIAKFEDGRVEIRYGDITLMR